MYIQSITSDTMKQEYGITMRRVYQVNEGPFFPPFGSAWAFIAPGEQSAPHAHDEDETFYIVSGKALMKIDAEEQEVIKGDTIYIPANCHHILQNIGDEELVFITVWWPKNGTVNMERTGLNNE